VWLAWCYSAMNSRLRMVPWALGLIPTLLTVIGVARADDPKPTEEMTDEDWRASFAKSLIVFLNGYAISEPDNRGERITDDSFLLLFNTGWEPLDFNVPLNHGKEWQIIVDTAQPWPITPGSGAKVRAGDVLHLTDRSMMVLQRPA